MSAPATIGQLRGNIQDMEVGDYIKFYHDGINYVMDNNTGSRTEIPTSGQANGLSALPMYWYGIKVAKGLIISDRVVRHTWNWDSINTSRSIESRYETISGVSGTLRSPTGGIAYADINGNMSLIDKGFGGFPTNNEWDKCIVNFPQDKIQAGKNAVDVFHWEDCGTWTQGTPANGSIHSGGVTTMQGTNTRRVYRGSHYKLAPTWNESSLVAASIGFRPVFDYDENQFN